MREYQIDGIELMTVPYGSRIERMEDRVGVIAFLPDGSMRAAELVSTIHGLEVLSTSVPKINIKIGLGGRI